MDNKFKQFIESNSWFWSHQLFTEDEMKILDNEESVNNIIKITPIIQDCLATSNSKTLIENLKNLKDTDTDDKIDLSLIVKSLMILLDISAETLDRLYLYCYYNKINNLSFDDNTTLNLEFFGKNEKINLSTDKITKLSDSNSAFFNDIINLMLYAGKSKQFESFYTFRSFSLVDYLGDKEKLTQFYFIRSIKNSSQIKQKRATNCGNLFQKKIINQIKNALLPFGVQESTGNKYLGTKPYDLVLFKPIGDLEISQYKWAIIEIAFQESTNSTIERKANQLNDGLFNTIDSSNHKVAFIIDGAGFIRRDNVTKRIFNNTHYAYNSNSDSISQLIDELTDYFNE